jgi:transglutaminase superfamily protein
VLNLRKLLSLSSREAWLLAQAALLLPAVRVALKFVTVAQVQNIVDRGLRAPQRLKTSPQATARIVRIAALRGLYHFKCLDQSLVLRWLLRRQGIDARIVFGARKQDEQMEIHAWVEVDGVAIGEDDGVNHRFSPLEELSPSISN